MEKNSDDLLTQIEKVFLNHNFRKNDNGFENQDVKFIYANHDTIIGHVYFLKVKDDLVETVYFSDVKMTNDALKRFSGYGSR